MKGLPGLQYQNHCCFITVEVLMQAVPDEFSAAVQQI